MDRRRLAATDRDRILESVSAAVDDAALADCVLVVGAVAEERTVKAAVLLLGTTPSSQVIVR